MIQFKECQQQAIYLVQQIKLIREKIHSAKKRVQFLQQRIDDMDHKIKGYNVEIDLLEKTIKEYILSTADLPSKDNLDKIESGYNTAFVVCGNRFFYIDKKANECVEKKIDREMIEAICRETNPTSIARKLSSEEFIKIDFLIKSGNKQDKKLESKPAKNRGYAFSR